MIIIIVGPFILAIVCILLVGVYRWLRIKYVIWSYRRERARRPLADRLICSRTTVEDAIPGFLKTFDELDQSNEEVDPCGCRRCLTSDSGVSDRRLYYYVICSKCGNKRCPHATNHVYLCTNSNESGQPGSAYE